VQQRHRKSTIYKSQQLILVILCISFEKLRKNMHILSVDLYHGPLLKYMKSLGIYDHNLSINTHVRSIIYWEIYHNIVYIANKGCHIRMEEINWVFFFRFCFIFYRQEFSGKRCHDNNKQCKTNLPFDQCVSLYNNVHINAGLCT
jgi:hypothetical protein